MGVVSDNFANLLTTTFVLLYLGTTVIGQYIPSDSEENNRRLSPRNSWNQPTEFPNSPGSSSPYSSPYSSPHRSNPNRPFGTSNPNRPDSPFSDSNPDSRPSDFNPHDPGRGFNPSNHPRDFDNIPRSRGLPTNPPNPQSPFDSPFSPVSNLRRSPSPSSGFNPSPTTPSGRTSPTSDIDSKEKSPVSPNDPHSPLSSPWRPSHSTPPWEAPSFEEFLKELKEREKGHHCKWNEEYSNCVSTCNDCKTRGKCATVLCKKGCDCKKGWHRDENGLCILAEFCPNPCGKNEEYSSCVKPCNDCKSKGACPVLRCVKGCDCKLGYFKDEHGICISEAECDEALKNPQKSDHPITQKTLNESGEPLKSPNDGGSAVDSAPNSPADGGEKSGSSGRTAAPSLSGGTKAPSLSGGTKAPSLSGGTKAPSLSGGTKAPSLSGGTESSGSSGDAARLHTLPDTPVAPKVNDSSSLPHGVAGSNASSASVQSTPSTNVTFPAQSTSSTNATTVISRDCPPGLIFYDCIPSCKHTCDNYFRNDDCPDTPCTPGCFCEKGLVKNKQGHCVNSSCCSEGTCCENEKFTLCVFPCSSCNVCEPCVFDKCSPGCDCKDGYKRDQNGKCIRASKCPKCSNLGSSSGDSTFGTHSSNTDSLPNDNVLPNADSISSVDSLSSAGSSPTVR